jgi:hypothetical protein
MNRRSYFISLLIVFLFGSISAIAVHERVKPNEAQKRQLLVDQAIRDSLCNLLEKDLGRFDEAPFSFRRSSLSQLRDEARAISKTRLPLSLGERGVEFRASESTLTRDCDDDAQRWVKIQSAIPEELQNDLRVVGLSHEPSKWPDSLPPLPSIFDQAKPESRLALVIGNTGYKSGALRNAGNDADDISSFLRSANFEVQDVRDANLSTLNSAIQSFSRKASNHEVVLIYYSGHGIEFNGRNYLVPVDASLASNSDIPRSTIDLQGLLEKINRARPKTVVAIIDACRNTPIFSNSRSASAGLSGMRPPAGTLIAFSAGPGQVALDGDGRNSPYTAALLQEMSVPNTPIELILKETRNEVNLATIGRQVPWYNSSLTGDFYFVRQ